jgi:hypothetical protein
MEIKQFNMPRVVSSRSVTKEIKEAQIYHNGIIYTVRAYRSCTENVILYKMLELNFCKKLQGLDEEKMWIHTLKLKQIVLEVKEQ